MILFCLFAYFSLIIFFPWKSHETYTLTHTRRNWNGRASRELIAICPVTWNVRTSSFIRSVFECNVYMYVHTRIRLLSSSRVHDDVTQHVNRHVLYMWVFLATRRTSEELGLVHTTLAPHFQNFDAIDSSIHWLSCHSCMGLAYISWKASRKLQTRFFLLFFRRKTLRKFGVIYIRMTGRIRGGGI